MKLGDTLRIEAVPTTGVYFARRAKRTCVLNQIAHGRAIVDLGPLVGVREFALKSGHSFGAMRDWRIEPDQMADLRALAKELKDAAKAEANAAGAPK